ncbi:MAG: acyl-CoA dehydrogenase family protein [Acidobacteriota bacterium]|nr:acyl-CoA dehydrogenase family protein [Acidobacteriota bacterium]
MSLLTPEQKAIQQQAREFAAKHIIPFASQYDKSCEFHPYLLEAAKESKIFAMAVPVEYGGLGYDALTQALVLEEWGYGCAGMGTTLAASILSMDSVLVAGTPEQKKLFFTPMLETKIGSFGLTEPGAGSDAGAGKTTAVKDGDSYILNGTKCWITNGGFADVYVIYASTDPTKGVKGLSAFILERGLEGFTVGTVDHKLGIRSSNTVELLMKDVRIPADHLLGKEGEGMKIAMMTLDLARPAIAALSVGLAQRSLDECVKHLQAKFPGKPQPGQTLQFKLADMETEIQAARQMLHHTMVLRDSGVPFSKESAIAKVFCSDVAMRITTQAVQLMGGYGYTSELGKYMRDSKIMQIYEGTNQIQRLVISRAVLAPAPAASAQKAGK